MGKRKREKSERGGVRKKRSVKREKEVMEDSERLLSFLSSILILIVHINKSVFTL